MVSELHAAFAPAGTAGSKPVWCAGADTWPELAGRLPAQARGYAEEAGFKAEPGSVLLLPGEGGKIIGALFGVEKKSAPSDAFLAGKLPVLLPAGVWHFESPPADARLAALAFALGGYKFSRYRKTEPSKVQLVLPEGVDGAELSRMAEAVFLVRDLVNTPANDFSPVELEAAAKHVADRFGAKFRSVVGDALLQENFPLVHAVGAAADDAPRLIDFTWGDEKHPKVTLVGKGVCFDTGGLNLKTDAGMILMKKDMGGAANALGLAQMIMGAKLPVRLRVIVPAVENSISSGSFRPGDVYKSRKGITVEIGNTDAEGRLILADALALADEEKPDLLFDFATLTGSARVALGPELPAAFTDDDRLAADLARYGTSEADPAWRMPLWRPYQALLDSKIADTSNISGGAHAGSITAALFLSRFVEQAKSWLHLDLFAWNPSSKPGRPEGGEAQTIRALYALLKDRYGK